MTQDPLISPLKAPLKGTIRVPGDKSISHRAILFSAMAEGVSEVKGVLDSDDVRSSLAAIQALGAQVNLTKAEDGSLEGTIKGWGAQGPTEPSEPIDCGNSGTTARLLMGILAPWDICVTLTGDDSLKKRPMRRITAPLMKMGAHFEPAEGQNLPLKICGSSKLQGIRYEAPMASAQLKTAVLLAGIFAKGKTTLIEPSPSRNHTELMLPEFGIPTTAANCTAEVQGGNIPQAATILVPGDPSSAAFIACAALLKPGSEVRIENVSLNTARIGFTRTLERMGADITITRTGASGKEPVGTISVRYTPGLRGCEIPADKIASLVDEVPVLSLVAAHAKGITVFREVSELRVKESNRLAAIIEGLSLLGVDAWEDGNDLYIEGNPKLESNSHLVFTAHNDHRLAMTWALVGLCGNKPVVIPDFSSVTISYPNFLSDIMRLGK